ncbi:MAG TPA: hypothetical protein VGO93_02710 [Candidatus Xenobia bacterium]|jgi:hypothetical protein
MDAVSRCRPDGKPLRAYVESHPDQTSDVTKTIRDASLATVDYLTKTLEQRQDTDRVTALDLLQELREGMRAVRQAPADQAAKNLEAAQQAGDALKAGQTVTTSDGPVSLLKATSESYPGQRIIVPKDALLYGDRTFNQRDDYWAVPEMGDYDAVTNATVQHAPEDHIEYEHRDVKDLQKGRTEGLAALLDRFDHDALGHYSIAATVQSVLSHPEVTASDKGSYHELDEAHSSTSYGSQSTVVASERGVFQHRSDLSASSGQTLSQSSDVRREVQASNVPTVLDALSGLNELREGLEHLTSRREQQVGLIASHDVKEQVDFQHVTFKAVPPPERQGLDAWRHRHDEPASERVDTPASGTVSWGYGVDHLSKNRPLGTLPFYPHSIDVEAPET